MLGLVFQLILGAKEIPFACSIRVGIPVCLLVLYSASRKPRRYSLSSSLLFFFGASRGDLHHFFLNEQLGLLPVVLHRLEPSQADYWERSNRLLVLYSACPSLIFVCLLRSCHYVAPRRYSTAINPRKLSHTHLIKG